jgi:hypothetical protein
VRTTVTLVGQNFASLPADNRVTFDGVLATVVSASANQLVVKPGRPAAQARWVAVSVEVAQQTSNAMTFELVPSGTPRLEQAPLIITPSGVVRVGADLYVASQGFLNSSGGLYRVEPDGRTTRVVGSRFIPHRDPSQSRYDAPQFLTSDGTNIWFTTPAGAVRRYHVATGTVSEVARLSGPLNGITRSPGGFLFISESGLRIHRLSPTGELTTLSEQALEGAFGLVADGSDVFVASTQQDGVIRIANAEGAYTVTPNFATSPWRGVALTVMGGKLVRGSYEGRLFAADRNTGGTMEPFLDPEGYGGFIYSLWADAEGSLFIAQPTPSAIRKIASGDTAATLAAAGFRMTSATVRLNSRWYFAGVGFPSNLPIPAGLSDGTVVELSDNGVSRIVARGGDIRGLVSLGDGRLALSDCKGRKISALNPQTGERSDLLTAADGLSCPVGLASGAGGTLFYVDVKEAGAVVGRRSAQGVHVPAFVTGLPKEAVQLAQAGNRLLVLTLEATADPQASLYAADATAGGSASVWLPSTAMRSTTGMGVSPSGTVFFARSNGELFTLDAENRLLSPFGSALVFPVPSNDPQFASKVLSLGFKPDGTLLMLDAMQFEAISVAP